MPHSSFKLIPGVDQNRTPTLNEAALSTTNLVRFVPDRNGLGLVQKLGGWAALSYTTPITNVTVTYLPTATITRALWAWEDTNAISYLAAGNQSNTSSFQSSLNVMTAGVTTNITPRTITTNPAVSFTTVSGSSSVQITDAGITATVYNSVYISTPVSVGGLILSGFYPIITASGGVTYTIQASDLFGNPQPATAPVTNGGAVPQFTTVSGSSFVSVTLANHGYSVGSTFAILVAYSFNGITLFGNYTVQSITSANVFVIQSPQSASASSSVYLNNGKANFVYYIGFGSIPAGSGYGIGGYGSGGYGSGTAITPTSGVPIYCNDWTLDNWGQILVACPVPAMEIDLTTTGASGNGTTATVTFSGTYIVPVGSSINIIGMTPTAYNGYHYVSASSAGSVSFLSAATGAQTVAGIIVNYDAASGPIFQWDPTSGNTIATVIPQAPAVNDGMFVAMPQRQILAYGSTFTGVQDPLLIRWCDVQNYGQWIAQSTNQAGSIRIPKGSRIIGGIQGPQQCLFWTDLALWSMQYIGQPYIYSLNELGTGCGMIGRKAAGSFNNVVYWMGQSQFFQLASDGVSPVPCPIWDVIFQQLDTTNVNKIRVAVNSQFSEIAWYYPTTESNGEVSNYVKYNTVIKQWDFGTLGRSAWINQSVLGPPIGADPTTLTIYQHEISPDAAGSAMLSSFQTGYFALDEANVKTFVDEVWPDMKWGYYNGTQSATVSLTFYATDYPSATPNTYGPFTLNQSTTFVSPRMRGRLVSIAMSSNDVGSFWRIGNMRYRSQPDGRY